MVEEVVVYRVLMVECSGKGRHSITHFELWGSATKALIG
jgi:hypothetical protein